MTIGKENVLLEQALKNLEPKLPFGQIACDVRVISARGKDGIWLLTPPIREQAEPRLLFESAKRSKTMHIRTCETCNQTYECLWGPDEHERSICYGCALKEICPQFCPEEGDFNTARLMSGEMSEKEYKWMMEDFRAVELGTSIREYDDDLPETSIWDDRCRKCDSSLFDEKCVCSDCQERLGIPDE